MRWSILIYLLLWCSCLPQTKERYLAEPLAPHVARADMPMFINEGDSIIIDAGLKPSTGKALSEKIILMPKAEQELIEVHEGREKETFSLKSIVRGRLFALMPKNKLKGGQRYGLYVLEDGGLKAHLDYVFQVKNAPARLLQHDLGKGSLPLVAHNRTRFSFHFDKPIFITQETGLQLLSDGQVIALKEIMVSHSTHSINVELNEGSLAKLGQEYSFVFSDIENVDGEKSKLGPFNFLATEAKKPMKALATPHLAISHDSVEVSWRLDQGHTSELFLGKDSGPHDCLGSTCPRISTAVSQPKKLKELGYVSRTFFSGLKPGLHYHFVLRAQDQQGHVVLGYGSFATASALSLRFAEILIKPTIERGERENHFEYIALFNSGAQSLSLKDLRLRIADLVGEDTHECEIGTAKPTHDLPPGHFLVLAGKDFDESNFRRAGNMVVLKVPEKNLCGGLSNEESKIITLLGPKNVLFDRYGGHLWQSPKGFGVMRIDPRGPDEPSNYCLFAPFKQNLGNRGKRESACVP